MSVNNYHKLWKVWMSHGFHLNKERSAGSADLSTLTTHSTAIVYL